MSKNLNGMPFTEIVEKAADLGRISRDSWSKLRAACQDAYLHELPVKFDWSFLMASSSITTIEEYTTGNASTTTDSRIATFSSDATLAAAMVGRKIKFSGSDVLYEISSFIGAQSIQILPPYQGEANLSSVAYSVYQPVYALAQDFDRFPKNGGVYLWQGGRKNVLSEENFEDYAENFAGNPSTPSKVRLVGMDTAGNQLVEFAPAPKDSVNIGYEYFKKLRPLRDSTAGFIDTINANATTVTGATNTRFNEMTTGDYIRVNALGEGGDSSWYRILAIAHDSSLTLATAFANTSITSSANYTISRPLEIPAMLQPAVMWGALRQITLDQNDQSWQFYNAKMAEVLSDGKRIYMSRPYSQQIDLVAEDYHYRR